MFIIDAGHGWDTEGKRSPMGMLPHDMVLHEYEINRHIADMVVADLEVECIPCCLLVPERKDIPLAERVARVNKIHDRHSRAILISIHCNAAGGTGWEVFTSRGATDSDLIAEVFHEQANLYLPQFRNRGIKEANFYILRKTTCPAVLTENLFMDTHRDLFYLMSAEGRRNLADLHVAAIKSIDSDDRF